MAELISEKLNGVNIITSVAIEKDGKYLLIQEAKKHVRGKWNFPTGRVEWREKIMDAAAREAREETGFSITLTDFCNVYYIPRDNKGGLTIRFNFWGKIDDNKKQAELADDVLNCEWKSKNELEELLKNNQLRSISTEKMMKDVLANTRAPLNHIKDIYK